MFPCCCFLKFCAIISISLILSSAVVSNWCSDSTETIDAFEVVDAGLDCVLADDLPDGCRLLCVSGGGGAHVSWFRGGYVTHDLLADIATSWLPYHRGHSGWIPAGFLLGGPVGALSGLPP